eukprot:scaffold100621_cov21-Tisochrysis_lutea.AAC.1
MQALMCRAELELTTPYAKLMCLGLGLMFLGKQDQAEATLEVCTDAAMLLLRKQDQAEATLELSSRCSVHSPLHGSNRCLLMQTRFCACSRHQVAGRGACEVVKVMKSLRKDTCRLTAVVIEQQSSLLFTKTLNERISRFAQLSVESCAYAGTGNVLKVQELLATCGEHIEGEGESDAWKVSMTGVTWPVSMHQGVAVLGIGMIAMGEPLGAQMAGRALEHLLQYGAPPCDQGNQGNLMRNGAPGAVCLGEIGSKLSALAR